MVETLRELHELDHQQKTEKLMVVVMFFEKEEDKFYQQIRYSIFTKVLHNIRDCYS
jgi:hypothetical protein